MGLFAPDATALHELVLTRLIDVPRTVKNPSWANFCATAPPMP